MAKVTRDGRSIKVERTDTDKPVVERPIDAVPSKVGKAVYNSWRTTYYMSFDSDVEARNAEEKCIQLVDFDKIAAWLDKQ